MQCLLMGRADAHTGQDILAMPVRFAVSLCVLSREKDCSEEGSRKNGGDLIKSSASVTVLFGGCFR